MATWRVRFGMAAGLVCAAVGAMALGAPEALAERDKDAKPAPGPTRKPNVVPIPGDMVTIAGGTFTMGTDDGSADEKPPHSVVVKAFQLDVTEVTVAAYKACVDAGKCTEPDKKDDCTWGRASLTDHPMNCVDWQQAKAFCGWAEKRLPTEEEWEYAARGAGGRKYPWGSGDPGNKACWNGEGNDVGKENRKGTCPVGKYGAGNSPEGVKDLAGNVHEWVADEHCDSYASSKKCSSQRVLRGGSWNLGTPSLFRGAARLGGSPTGFRYATVGFRCVRAQ